MLDFRQTLCFKSKLFLVLKFLFKIIGYVYTANKNEELTMINVIIDLNAREHILKNGSTVTIVKIKGGSC